jgi:heat shock protein 1/8
VVSFTENECKVGFAAKNEQITNPLNTVYDAKRLIGRDFSDEHVQKDLCNWPFEVEKGPNNKPLIVVDYQGKRKQFYP